MEEFRRRLEEALELKGLSRAQASELMGLGRNTIQWLLTEAKGPPGPATIHKIADFLRWSDEDILQQIGLLRSAPSTTADDPLEALERVLQRGPWSQATCAALLTLAAQTFNVASDAPAEEPSPEEITSVVEQLLVQPPAFPWSETTRRAMVREATILAHRAPRHWEARLRRAFVAARTARQVTHARLTPQQFETIVLRRLRRELNNPMVA